MKREIAKTWLKGDTRLSVHRESKTGEYWIEVSQGAQTITAPFRRLEDLLDLNFEVLESDPESHRRVVKVLDDPRRDRNPEQMEKLLAWYREFDAAGRTDSETDLEIGGEEE